MVAHVFPVIVGDPFNLPYAIPMTQKDKIFTNHEFNPDLSLDEELDLFHNTGKMASTGDSSPFIKDEPDDSVFTTNNFAASQRGYSMQIGQQFGEGSHHSVDPLELTMPTGNFNPYQLSSQQNISSSFNLGNSVIGDDELLDLDLNDGSGHINRFAASQDLLGLQDDSNLHNFFPAQEHPVSSGGQNQISQVYSNTPDGPPIQSPFTHENFNYSHFGMPAPMAHISHPSPRVRPGMGPLQGMDQVYASPRPRKNLPQKPDPQLSDSRSPMTPKTPGLNALSLATPESGSIPSQPIHTNFNPHRHHKTLSNQWDNTPGCIPSDIDSPLSSPGHPASHAQISEILKSGKHASLPAKVENGSNPNPAYQSQEAKRRRRRESHNMVERRRRDNINERIQELSHLVPLHRLEDEKVRKHVQSNSPLSPTLATVGRSPPQATSLLAGGSRRATGAGSISLGIPIEDKDKAPNKGDILNGAVSWTRDLMWALHVKIQQESELADYITSIGGNFPFEQTEDEKRMRSELLNAMAVNDASTFSYTRGPGSGLRVPNHTTLAGDPLHPNQMGTLSPQSLSPGVQSGGSGANSGGHGQPQFWNNTGHDQLSLREEDEYGMDMN